VAALAEQSLTSRASPAAVDHQDAAAINRPVLMVLGGGLENGGGIGRMVGYAVAAWNRQKRAPMMVVDTRGPKHRRSVWPLFLLKSGVQIIRSAHRRPLVHIHIAANTSTLRKVIIAYLVRALRLKYVLQLHDPKYAEFYDRLSPWAQARVRSMYGNAARVIALGRPAAAMIRDLLRVAPDRIEIVPNAVPGPVALERDGARDLGVPHILFLGELHRRKGVHDLIDALASKQLAQLPWRATFAGGGSEQPDFEAQAVKAGIRDRIEFPGWLPHPQIRDLLLAADILVLPSYAEEMAMSVLEGMAYGLCVVCTPVGAQAEVVTDKVSAHVVTPGNIGELADALTACVTDPDLRQRLGRGARDAYLARFNIDDYPDLLAAVYGRALAI
jgi:glycosyltransferase involved in cell wall biosynthesis